MRWTRGAWRWVGGVAVAAVLAVGMVACGDDNEPEEQRDTTDVTTVGASAAGTDAAADGDPEAATTAADEGAPPALEQPSPTPTPRPVGTDAEYVKGICLAMTEFFRDVEAAKNAIDPNTPSGVAQQFAAAFWPPLTRFKEDLNQVAPPADLMAWHDTVAEQLGHTAARIMAGDALSEIARLGDQPLPDFPPEAQERLAAAAAAAPECQVYEELLLH